MFRKRFVSENDEIKVTTTTNDCQTYREEVGNLLLTATSKFEFYYMGLVEWLAHLARKQAFSSQMIMHYA